MLVKCGFGSQKTVKSTLKRSYLSSRFFESVLHLMLKSLRLLEFSMFSMGIIFTGRAHFRAMP